MANIILDVDGTLWDSTEQVAIAWNKTLQDYPAVDKVLTANELKGLFGRPVWEIFEAVFPNVQDEERRELAQKCTLDEHVFMHTAPCVVFEGVKEGIVELSKKHKLYIVSNCMSGYIDAFLDNTKLSAYIEDQLCMGDTGRSKGENIREIMEKNALETAVYVGDTMGDFSASKKAGVPFIHAAYGFGKVEAATCSISSFAELLELDYEALLKENSAS